MPIKALLHKLNLRETKILPEFNQLSKFLVLGLAIFCSIFIVKSIFAQSTGPDYLKAKQTAIQKGNNQESWMNEALSSNMVSGIQALTGPIPNDVLEGKNTSFLPGGAIGLTTQLTASLYNPPASGIQYIATIKDNLLGKPAYAQGIGFQGLQPILPLWREFRNVIYILTSLFFIITGIMVMLRIKISPQAVVTVQSAIPQIITTLILVTFSYAIAGLLIDLSYVIQSLFLAILFNAKGGLASKLFNGGINYSFSDLSQGGMGVMFGLMWKATPFLSLMALAGIPTVIIGAFMSPFILITALPTLGLTPAIAIGVAASGFVLTFLILLIMIIVWLTKFFFGCIKCYIIVIIKIILAPLEIGLGAIPNSKLNFSTWILDLIANLAVFPISIIFLVLANVIIDASSKGLWAPQIINGSDWTLLPTKLSGGLVPVAVGLATLMILSKLPAMIPEFIFKIKPSPWGKAIGESLKPVSDFGKFAGRGGLQYASGEIERMNDSSRTRRVLRAIRTTAEMTGIVRNNRH